MESWEISLHISESLEQLLKGLQRFLYNLKQDGASDSAASLDLDPTALPLSGTKSCYISALSAAATFTLHEDE